MNSQELTIPIPKKEIYIYIYLNLAVELIEIILKNFVKQTIVTFTNSQELTIPIPKK